MLNLLFLRVGIDGARVPAVQMFELRRSGVPQVRHGDCESQWQGDKTFFACSSIFFWKTDWVGHASSTGRQKLRTAIEYAHAAIYV